MVKIQDVYNSDLKDTRISSLNMTNINGRDDQRKNVVNNVDKSSLWAPWQNGPYKNTQNISKHGVYKDATDIRK